MLYLQQSLVSKALNQSREEQKLEILVNCTLLDFGTLVLEKKSEYKNFWWTTVGLFLDSSDFVEFTNFL